MNEFLTLEARKIRVRGIVQGVGFRPFVYRLALERQLTGWVLNDAAGVQVHLEGTPIALESFLIALKLETPPAARIEALEVEAVPAEGFAEFSILKSSKLERPSVRISPDLAVCDDCLNELFDPNDRRFGYPYINCINCGPRYSIILELPYDREHTTMREWSMCSDCQREYNDPSNRRFHAQPIACPACGPHLELHHGSQAVYGDETVIQAVQLLQEGQILAIKGIGGYHLACNARDANAVQRLRERKFRKEKPFAVMARDLEVAKELIELTPEVQALLLAPARPIVLAPARLELAGVATGYLELGVMLPYTPLHHLLFAYGAPDVLVMTSANRSSEPIAYQDQDALERLVGIADAFLIGQRAIARHVDDSVMRVSSRFDRVVLRRARGLAPSAVARLPSQQAILAVGGDLKNTVALTVNSQVIVSQHLGDLENQATFSAFEQTVYDLCRVHELQLEDCLVAHDLHPSYHSSAFALELPARAHVAVQHHRAHIASVLAEHQAFETRVLGIALDGTGYGDDGTIWGGEFFVGNLNNLERIAHLESVMLPGGGAAARFPVQSAAGFLANLETPDLSAAPFHFPDRYFKALKLVRQGVRCHASSSTGRLFDAVAALCGFTREITFEGQAAIWLEQLAQHSPQVQAYPFGFDGRVLRHRDALEQIVQDRIRGRRPSEIARAFHAGLAHGVFQTALALCEKQNLDTVALSGGVMQNALLLDLIHMKLTEHKLQVWTNLEIPPNDSGISLGQSALCAFSAPIKTDTLSHFGLI